MSSTTREVNNELFCSKIVIQLCFRLPRKGKVIKWLARDERAPFMPLAVKKQFLSSNLYFCFSNKCVILLKIILEID